MKYFNFIAELAISFFSIFICLDNVHCKNEIVKMTNLLVSTVARNSNLICHVGCYEYTRNYNLISIS